MRVLLDECVPARLKQDIIGHDIATIAEMRWRGIKNGALLRLAQPQFDVLLTVDQNLPYQQNLFAAQIAVIVLVTRSTRLATLRPLVPQVLTALQTIQPGELIRISPTTE